MCDVTRRQTEETYNVVSPLKTTTTKHVVWRHYLRRKLQAKKPSCMMSQSLGLNKKQSKKTKCFLSLSQKKPWSMVSLPQKKVTITLKYCHYYVRRFEFPKALYKFPVIIVIISKVNRDVWKETTLGYVIISKGNCHVVYIRLFQKKTTRRWLYQIITENHIVYVFCNHLKTKPVI